METSLRYGRDSKGLTIHAKEKFGLDSNTFLQAQGEVESGVGGGAPRFLCAMIRHLYPDVAASLGVGVKYHNHKLQKMRYFVRGKKAFPLTTDALFTFNVKASLDTDTEFKQKKTKGAAEFAWSIFNFQRDQDVRFKVGYEVVDKVPYFQIRENNWTLNADMNGGWNVRFDL